MAAHEQNPFTQRWNLNPPRVRDPSTQAAEQICQRVADTAGHLEIDWCPFDRWLVCHPILDIGQAIGTCADTQGDARQSSVAFPARRRFV